ncbi:MAG TPA: diacylglycerol kinase family protein [Polyangiaceae bacterium]|jgi:diacylglycerol kinase family enzyme|nr:diacylglycerol kinase family protein [Polyangiaceae bacterium]
MPSYPPDAAPRSLRPTSDRIAVVVNGNARSVTSEVISTLDQILLGGDLFVSRRLEEGPELARTIINRGYGTVLTGGGDGTFTTVLTDVVREARRQSKPLPRFGFLKLGTGNALAWVVGASGAKKRGLAADIQRLREDAGSRPVRFIEVEDVMAPFAGFGVDAVVLQDYDLVKKRLSKTVLKRIAPGPLSYAISTVTRSIPSYFIRQVPHCRVINDGSDAFRLGPKGAIVGLPIPRGQTIYEGPARIAALSTIPYYGFGLRAFPYAEERPDRMNLRISSITPIPFIRNFRAIWRGEYENATHLSDYLVDAVTFELDPPTPFQIGGDPQGERARVQAVLSPTTVRLVDFYAPPSAA